MNEKEKNFIGKLFGSLRTALIPVITFLSINRLKKIQEKKKIIKDKAAKAKAAKGIDSASEYGCSNYSCCTSINIF